MHELISELELRPSNRPDIQGARTCFGASSTGGRWPSATISAATAACEDRIREILKTLRRLPGYPAYATFSSLQICKDHAVGLHTDAHNFGVSYVTTSGEYTGGDLVVGDEHLDPRDKVCSFDGRAEHQVMPFEGHRFSLVAFTHSLHGDLNAAERIRLQGMGFPLPRWEETSGRSGSGRRRRFSLFRS